MYVMEMLLYISFAPSAIFSALAYNLQLLFNFLSFSFGRFNSSSIPSLFISQKRCVPVHVYKYSGLPKSDMHACINYMCLFGRSWRCCKCSNRIHLNLLYIFLDIVWNFIYMYIFVTCKREEKKKRNFIFSLVSFNVLNCCFDSLSLFLSSLTIFLILSLSYHLLLAWQRSIPCNFTQSYSIMSAFIA